MGNKKTIHQLWLMFKERYKDPNEISVSVALMTLRGYLDTQMERNEGHFIHEPSDYIQSLLRTYLGHEHPKGMQTKSVEAGRITDQHRERCCSCFYASTCQFLEYGMTKSIIECTSFKPNK